MKRIIIILFLSTIAISAHTQPPETKLDSLMDLYATEYHFNGTAFIAKNGLILLEKGFGYRDIEKKELNDEHTIFQMGSITKQFTAEIVLQLAANRQLNLDDKLAKYIPDYPNGEKITIKNLLTHTSGIFNYTKDSSWENMADRPAGRESIIAMFKYKPLQFKPGSKFEYSNSNYFLLGYIIEKVTHKKYEAVVRENILIPCGMTHSGFDFAGLQDKNKAKGYYYINGKENKPAPIADSSSSFAAGALYSTIGDMYKWHLALESRKLLPGEWQEQAYKPFKDNYAYGWFVDNKYNKRVVAHSGGIPGFYTYELRIEEDNVDILLLQNNQQPDIDNKTIATKITECLYDKKTKIPDPPVLLTVSPQILKQYEGDYVISPEFIINIKQVGSDLFAQATGQQAFKIVPVSETLFYSKVTNSGFEFIKKNGKVTKMILHQEGQDVAGTRK